MQPLADTPQQLGILDSAIALEIAVGIRQFDTAADMNGDGCITSLDALMILQTEGMATEC